jgi:hypothetical protein
MRRQVRQVAFAAVALAAGAALAESRVERPEFVVAIAGPAQTGAGASSAFAVTVAARGSFHVNHEYPSSFRVAPAAPGLRYPREKVDRATGIVLEPCGAGENACSARLLVPFIAETAGAHTVGGTLAFSVCDDARCLIEKVAVSLPVAAR